MICELLAFSIIHITTFNYCDPMIVVNPDYSYANNLYWKCDCTRARKSIGFVIQENIDKAIDWAVNSNVGNSSSGECVVPFARGIFSATPKRIGE